MMKIFRQKYLFFMLITVLCICISTNALAAAYTHIVAFGDSLSDHGGLSSYNQTMIAYGGQAVPESWTNDSANPYGGDVWIDYLKDRWGATLDNNAIGGAMTLGHENTDIQALIDASILPDLGFTGQVNAYLSTSPTYDTEKTLFAIWIGGNDLLEFFRGEYYAADPTVLISDSIGRIITGIGALYADGARNFLVLNLPDLAKTPAFNTKNAATQAQVNTVVVNFNSALASALSDFSTAHQDTMVHTVDAYDYLNQIIADDEFSDSTSAYLNVDGDCNWDFLNFNGTFDQFLFFDCIHPTTRAHEIVSSKVADVISKDIEDRRDGILDTVQKAYIAYYLRPADPGGLYWWANQLEDSGGDMNAIINAFANSEESTRLWGEITPANIGEFINNAYMALFNRPADADGKQFYIDGFNDGVFTLGTIVLNILDGALNADADAIANKLDYSNKFASVLDPDGDYQSPYTATYAADDEQTARNLLAKITCDSDDITEQQVKTDIIEAIADPGDAILNLVNGDVVSFTLIQSTDVHHRASGSGSSLTYSPADGVDSSCGADQTEGGYARLTTKIAQIRLSAASQNTPTVLVDSGDFLMGTVYDMTMGVSPAAFYFLEFMNYDAVTFGNHEFDYGPAGLAMVLNNARGADGSGFTVPIVASNMNTDGVAGTDDDGIEAFMAAGAIQPTMVKTLDNGLKVGIMGLLGNNAENDAPLAGPVTFDHDYADIQQTVDHLKNDLGAHIVIALSHSGITNPEGTPGGDDIALAQNVTGIDIIAAGHEHEMTPEIVTENGTRIICAGYYGKNLAQLDITVTVGSGVTDAALTNHPIDDATPGDPAMNAIVGIFNAGIDEVLEPQLGIGINDVVTGSGSANLGIPIRSEETGMGNLVADSLRYMLGGMNGAIGIVASGVVREGFDLSQQVTFADMYSVLPLGMTVDPTQQNVPGYPLMQVNLTGEHVKNMCQLAAYVIAAGDEALMAQLANPAHPGHALYSALLNLKSSYYLNLSGLRYTHAGAAGMYQIVPGSVTLYDGVDFKCEGSTDAAVEDAALYPCVMDIYMYFVMQSADLQALLAGLHLPIVPLNNAGEPITPVNMLDSRLDRDPATAGIQEVKEWMAFLTFLTAPPELGGFADHIIPETNYGQTALSTGSASRVNEMAPTP